MRNKYLLICNSCGYLSTDYVSEKDKYTCPLCNNQLKEIIELTSDNYNNFLYKKGVHPSHIKERENAVRRNFMSDYTLFDENNLQYLEFKYNMNCPVELQVHKTINITDPQIKNTYEKTLKEAKEAHQKYLDYLNGKENKKEPDRHCPVCNSTNVKPISTVARAVHGVAFGLFSKTARSQFECKSCGYKF